MKRRSIFSRKKTSTPPVPPIDLAEKEQHLREHIDQLKCTVAHAMTIRFSYTEEERMRLEQNMTPYLIDLARNLPPIPESAEILREGLAFLTYILQSSTEPPACP